MSKLLTVAEVAERLRIHPMTVRRHIKSGRIRATRIGRSVRVPEDAIATPTPELNDEELYQQLRSMRRPQMTPEDVIAWVSRKRTPEELARLKRLGEDARRRRDEAGPIGIPSDVLVRVGRRGDEVSYGEKTWEELIAEESEPLDS